MLEVYVCTLLTVFITVLTSRGVSGCATSWSSEIKFKKMNVKGY